MDRPSAPDTMQNLLPAIILIYCFIIIRIRDDPVIYNEQMHQANASTDSDPSNYDLFDDGVGQEEEDEIILNGGSLQPIPETLDHLAGADQASSNAASEDDEICIHGDRRSIQEGSRDPRQCSMEDLLVNASTFPPLPRDGAQLQQPTEQAQTGATSTVVMAPSETDTRGTPVSQAQQRPARPETPENAVDLSSLVTEASGQAAAAASVPVSTDKPPPSRDQRSGGTKGAQGRSGRPPGEQTSPPPAPDQSAAGNTTPQASAAMEGEATPRLARGSAEEAADQTAQRNLPPERDRLK